MSFSDGSTLEEFVRKESLEHSGREAGQQLQTCLSLADGIIMNDGTLQDLRRRVREVLGAYGVDLPEAAS